MTRDFLRGRDDQAIDEVMANACQTMLLHDKFIKQMARQNMTLAEKVADALEDLSAKIRDAFDGLDPATDERAIFDAVRAVVDQADEIAERWSKGIAAAVEGYNAAQTVRQATGAQKESAPAKAQKQAWNSGDLMRTYISYADTAARDKAFENKAKSLAVRGKVVKVSPSEINDQAKNADWNSLKAVRKYLRNALQSIFGTDSVHFAEKGTVIEAYLTKDGRKHTASNITTPAGAAAIAKAHELIANAEYVFSTRHDEHSKSGSRVSDKTVWDYFEALVSFDSTTMPVRFTLRDVPTDVREQIYKIGINGEGASPINRVPNTGRLVVSGETPSGAIIAPNAGGSKSQKQGGHGIHTKAFCPIRGSCPKGG